MVIQAYSDKSKLIPILYLKNITYKNSLNYLPQPKSAEMCQEPI